MANNLGVNAESLRAAATSGDRIADGLTETSHGPVGTQPSSAGIAALDTAIASARARQATYVSGNANAVNTANARYDHTDADAAQNLRVTV